MPKQITKVRWSASNVPYGVDFNNTNGTFSGTPEDEGEYTVPVSVTTNYGTASENVKININGVVVLEPEPEPELVKKDIITKTNNYVMYANRGCEESLLEVQTNATSSEQPLRWFVDNSTLPYGVVLRYENSTTGEVYAYLSKVDREVWCTQGTYYIDVGVINSKNYYDKKTLTLTIRPFIGNSDDYHGTPLSTKGILASDISEMGI